MISTASWPTLAVETIGWRLHLGPQVQGSIFTHDDEGFSLEVTLGWGVELVMHGADVVLRVITPQWLTFVFLVALGRFLCTKARDVNRR